MRRSGRVIGGLHIGQQGIVTQEETRGSLAKILPRVRLSNDGKPHLSYGRQKYKHEQDKVNSADSAFILLII